MHSLAIALLLGFPLVALAAAIALMIWRAFKPKGNRIRGLTSPDGRIVNPYIHLGVSITCLVIATISGCFLLSSPAGISTSLSSSKSRLDLWIIVFMGLSLSMKFFQNYKKVKRNRAKADA
jgi:hypothetical protein